MPFLSLLKPTASRYWRMTLLAAYDLIKMITVIVMTKKSLNYSSLHC